MQAGALALVEDYRPGVDATPLAEQQTAIQLLLDLEAAGMVSPVALTITDPNLPYEKAEALAVFVGSITRRNQWYAGDLLLYCEAVFPTTWPQIAYAMGLSESTMMHRMFVARQVPPERRIPDLAFSCHALVARKSPAEQAYWLNEAASRGWGYIHLRDAIRATRHEQEALVLVPPQEPPLAEPQVSMALVFEAAQAVLRDAVPTDDEWVSVPIETFRRLQAAFNAAM